VIFGVTSIVIIIAYTISQTLDNSYLMGFYTFLALTVFGLGLFSRITYVLLGLLLFARFVLENYQLYQWSPVGQLALGHFLIALVTYFVIKGDDDDRFLIYFPILMLLQGIADLSYLSIEYSGYHMIHNTLALMQMSAFCVLAVQHRKYHEAKDDPIEELISRLTRTMMPNLLYWKRRFTYWKIRHATQSPNSGA